MSATASPARVLTLLLGCALLLPACDGASRDPLTVLAPEAAEIVIHGGDNQVAAAGTTLPVPLSVLVTAADGRPVQGVKIRWSVSVSSGSVAGLDGSLTDDHGIARATRRLSGNAGRLTTAAVIEASGLGVNFTTVSQVQGAYRMLLLPGDVLIRPGDTVLAALPAPLRVLIEDHEERPVPGVTVKWAATGGSVPGESSVSDAQGIAEMTFTRGPSAGLQTVRASVSGLGGSPMTFVTTTAPGSPVALEKISGDDQAAAVFTALADPFVVHAMDAHGNSVPGVPISWFVAQDTLAQTTTALSLAADARPVAQYTHQLGGEQGAHVISAAVAGRPDIAPVSFTVMASPAPPIAVGVHDYDYWYYSYDCWFTCGFQPSYVTVQPGQPVVWTWQGIHGHDVVFEDDPTAPVSSALKTTGSHMRIFETPGTYRYRCTAHSSSFTTGMVGTVVVSGPPSDATTLEKVSGDGQTGIVGTGLAPFVVHVADAEGHSVAGVTISWIAETETGPVVIAQSTTTAHLYLAGELRPVASYSHVLGAEAGVHTVMATVESRPDIAPVSFTFTAEPAPDPMVGVYDWGVGWYDCWYYGCGFLPSQVTVSAGKTVTWTWHGTQAHNVVFEDAATPPVSSATQAAGTHTRTFTTPGTYRYRCTVHSTSFTEGMVGRVVVL
ncbi:MAG TPA: Ig-like domain-containing protein [Longimicrobiales bacterium]|nr:Ig-like domain-containing protein [Longimicrobiales bacterium]